MVAATHEVLGSRIAGRSRMATVALVVGFALLTALAAQWEIMLGFTPVPVSGQTFAVLLSGAALGTWAGASSQLLYLALAAAGLPFFSGGESGIQVFAGPTSGYLVGFVVAAALVGRLAEHRADRRVLTAVPAFAAGSVVMYAFGMLGLVVLIGMSPGEAFVLGVVPFLVGDALKAAIAGLVLPAAWKLTGARRG